MITENREKEKKDRFFSSGFFSLLLSLHCCESSPPSCAFCESVPGFGGQSKNVILGGCSVEVFEKQSKNVILVGAASRFLE